MLENQEMREHEIHENCERKEAFRPEPVPVQQTTPTPPAPEIEEEEDEEEAPKPKKGKKDKNKGQTSLFRFFEKVQNFGGTVFNDEE